MLESMDDEFGYSRSDFTRNVQRYARLPTPNQWTPLMSNAPFNEFNGPGGRFISVDSARIAECMGEWRAKRMIGIHISSMGAFKATDVNFLKDYPDVTSVFVSEGGAIDLRGLQFLQGLMNLGLTNYQKPVPLSEFKELKTFGGDWSPGLDLGVHCRSLESVTLWKYKGKDFTEFPLVPSLNTLELVQPTFVSLDGIKRHTHIQRLQFERCAKLTSIDAIAELNGGKLESLVFSRCRKISDFGALGRLATIKKIVIEFCGSLDSLEFLTGCSQLETFGCFETSVVSGDLSPLLRLPQLTFAGTGNKKHYSHKESDLNDALKRQNNSVRIAGLNRNMPG
jgi:hypothetical protein